MKKEERIIEEFKFTGRFEPLTLQQAKVICDVLEEYLAKYLSLGKSCAVEACIKECHARENVYVIRIIAVPDLWIRIAVASDDEESSRPLV